MEWCNVRETKFPFDSIMCMIMSPNMLPPLDGIPFSNVSYHPPVYTKYSFAVVSFIKINMHCIINKGKKNL